MTYFGAYKYFLPLPYPATLFLSLSDMHAHICVSNAAVGISVWYFPSCFPVQIFIFSLCAGYWRTQSVFSNVIVWGNGVRSDEDYILLVLESPFRTHPAVTTEKAVMLRIIIQDYLLYRSHPGTSYPENPEVNLGGGSIKPIFPVANSKPKKNPTTN